MHIRAGTAARTQPVYFTAINIITEYALRLSTMQMPIGNICSAYRIACFHCYGEY